MYLLRDDQYVVISGFATASDVLCVPAESRANFVSALSDGFDSFLMYGFWEKDDSAEPTTRCLVGAQENKNFSVIDMWDKAGMVVSEQWDAKIQAFASQVRAYKWSPKTLEPVGMVATILTMMAGVLAIIGVAKLYPWFFPQLPLWLHMDPKGGLWLLVLTGAALIIGLCVCMSMGTWATYLVRLYKWQRDPTCRSINTVAGMPAR